MASLEHNGAQDLAGARRVDVVSHVSNGRDRKHGARRNVPDRMQKIVPAPGTRPDRDKVHRDAGQEPQVVGRPYRLPELIQPQSPQREPNEEHADQYADPELPLLHIESFYHAEN